jgi:predicted SprT family Zn-dependent metalloprotease
MLLLKQLELNLPPSQNPPPHGSAIVEQALRLPHRSGTASVALAPQRLRGRDGLLETEAREILSSLGAARLGASVQVEWNPRLRTCAGRADFRHKLISLNPQLSEHGSAEIDRTLRHELAHLVAQFRVGRRRISPHGPEWRQACTDLSIAGEGRCHNLPFASTPRTRRFLYKCPSCKKDFPRVRRIRRAIACLACCRAHSRGKFDARFRLRLASTAKP